MLVHHPLFLYWDDAFGCWWLHPRAECSRFVVFHCADDYYEASDGSARYYESIDMFDAFHPPDNPPKP